MKISIAFIGALLGLLIGILVNVFVLLPLIAFGVLPFSQIFENGNAIIGGFIGVVAVFIVLGFFIGSRIDKRRSGNQSGTSLVTESSGSHLVRIIITLIIIAALMYLVLMWSVGNSSIYR
ncbi:hypothetical protein KW782_01080 [Candidatus Parcubacteria bacterium]|nr:hypothetical protein [Candidatus Parcubacteria bacterium]